MYEMKTKPQRSSVTYNPAVSASAEELDDDDENEYVNSAICTVNYDPDTPHSADQPGTRIQFLVKSLAPVAVCWAVLLVIMVLRIHFTSVLSTKLTNEMDVSATGKQNLELQVNQLEQTQAAMKEDIKNLETEKQQLREEKQRLNKENQRLNEENQHVKRENQQLRDENQHLNKTNQSLNEENQRLKEIHTDVAPTYQPWTTKEIHTDVTPTYQPWTIKENHTPVTPTYQPWTMKNSTHQQQNYTTSYYYGRWRRSLPCPAGWIHFLSSCYAIDRHDPRSWDDARDECRGQGANLVVIETAEEQDFISNSTVADLGSDSFWIGLRVELGSWKWITGSNLTQEYWTVAPGEDQSCATSVTQTRGWRAVSCADKHGWICEKKAD